MTVIDPRQHELPRRKLGAAEIASLLRRDMAEGRLAPRERLPAERRLAEIYGVARGTIREALNQIESEGLVETRRGSGTYVTYNLADNTSGVIVNARPLELMDTRFALEPHICRLAVLHATAEDFDRADTLLDQMEASVDDPVAFSIADTQMHVLLAESTRNDLLIWIIGQINSVRNQRQWSHMRNITLDRETIVHYNQQHRRIWEAIKDRQPEEAAQLMKQHLESARLSLTRAAAT